MLKITNVATVQSHEIVSDNFQIVRIVEIAHRNRSVSCLVMNLYQLTDVL